MLLFPMFYKHVGARFLKDFISPKIIDASTFIFPRKSVYHNFVVSDVIDNLSKDDFLLQNCKQIIAKNTVEYKGESIGKFIKLSKPVVAVISDMAKKEKRIVFRKPNMGAIPVKLDTLLVEHYGALNYFYKYQMHPLSRWYKYYNTLQTVILKIVEELSDPNTPIEEARYRFLVLDLPDNLPGRKILDKYSENMTVAYLKRIPNYRYFIVLEFWKLLTPSLRDKSLFNLIPIGILKKINIIFRHNQKASVFNLGLLLGLVKEYNLEISVESLQNDIDNIVVSREELDTMLLGDIDLSTEVFKINQSFKSEIVKKLFFIFVYKIIKKEFVLPTENKEDKKVDKTTIKTSNVSETPVLLTEVNEDEEDTTVDLNKVLDEDIVEDNEDFISDDEITEVLTTKQDNKEVNKITKKVKESKKEDDGLLEDEQEDYSIDYSDVEDIYAQEVSDTLNTNKVTEEFSSLEDLYSKDYNQELDLTENIDVMTSNKIMSKKESERLKSIIKTQKSKPSPYKDLKVSTGELLDNSKDNYDIDLKDTEVSDNISVIDKKSNRNTLQVIQKKYIKEQYKKDIVRSIYSIQNKNTVIEDYQIEEDASIMGVMEQHTISIKMLDGKRITFKVMLPKVNDDGTMVISKNTYRIRSLLTERVINKINTNQVILNSYYSKIFINRAYLKRNDRGYWVYKYLSNLLQNDEKMKELIANEIKVIDSKIPTQYAYICRYIEKFVYDKYTFYFNFNNRASLLSDSNLLNQIENNQYVLVGLENKTPIVMDSNDNIYRYENNNYIPLPSILEIIGLEEERLPIEYAIVNIIGGKIPVVLLLSYYIGFSSLLKLLNVKYSVHKVNERIPTTKDSYVITFKDVKLNITRDRGKGDLIIAGLLDLKDTISNFNLNILNSKDGCNTIYTKLGYNSLLKTEIKLLENLFVDPMTLTMLKKMKEPTTFKGLLIRAVELLSIEQYKHPKDIAGINIKGYERIAGMLYNNLINSLRDYENSSYFGRGKFVFYPYKIIEDLNEDSTTVLVDDLNPVIHMKQIEDTSFTGKGGRSKIGMSKDTRVLHGSEIGVISEAVKDSGDVGITALLTANPSLVDTKGDIGDNKVEENDWSRVLSTPNMLMPFTTRDDAKRAVFTTTQMTHGLALTSAKSSIIRSGYETIFAVRSADKFVTSAIDSGKVLKVDNKSITVEYSNGNKKTYKLNKWTTKEEAGSCYTHIVVANLKEGDTFSKDDTICYDKLFFEPDIFNPKRVIYKSMVYCNVAIREDQQTLEDSCTISSTMNKTLAVNVTKVKSYVLEANKSILNLVKIGDKLDPTSPVFTIANSEIIDKDNVNERTLEILKDLQNVTPKAGYRGTVSKIVILYNCAKSEMSRSLLELVEASDKKLLEDVGYVGKVTDGYSINGKKLLNGQIEIKIYIDIEESMSIGDKGVLGNQLKFTVGEVYDNKLTTEDGEEIDAVFSYKNIAARIVMSAYLTGTTAAVVEQLQKNAVEMYFK